MCAEMKINVPGGISFLRSLCFLCVASHDLLNVSKATHAGRDERRYLHSSQPHYELSRRFGPNHSAKESTIIPAVSHSLEIFPSAENPNRSNNNSNVDALVYPGRYGHLPIYLKSFILSGSDVGPVILYMGGQVKGAGTHITNDVLMFRPLKPYQSRRGPDPNPQNLAFISSGLPPTAWASGDIDSKGRIWVIGGVVKDCRHQPSAYIRDLSEGVTANWTAWQNFHPSYVPARRRQAQAVRVIRDTPPHSAISRNSSSLSSSRFSNTTLIAEETLMNDLQRHTEFWILGGVSDPYTCSAAVLGYLGIDKWDTETSTVNPLQIDRVSDSNIHHINTAFTLTITDYTATSLHPSGRRVAYIGGQLANGTLAPMEQVLVLDTLSERWNYVPVAGSVPSRRLGHASVVLASLGATLVHGGLSSTFEVSSETYILNTTSTPWKWTQLKLTQKSIASPARAFHSMHLISSNTILISFGIEPQNILVEGREAFAILRLQADPERGGVTGVWTAINETECHKSTATRSGNSEMTSVRVFPNSPDSPKNSFDGGSPVTENESHDEKNARPENHVPGCKDAGSKNQCHDNEDIGTQYEPPDEESTGIKNGCCNAGKARTKNEVPDGENSGTKVESFDDENADNESEFPGGDNDETKSERPEVGNAGVKDEPLPSEITSITTIRQTPISINSASPSSLAPEIQSTRHAEPNNLRSERKSQKQKAVIGAVSVVCGSIALWLGVIFFLRVRKARNSADLTPLTADDSQYQSSERPESGFSTTSLAALTQTTRPGLGRMMFLESAPSVPLETEGQIKLVEGSSTGLQPPERNSDIEIRSEKSSGSHRSFSPQGIIRASRQRPQERPSGLYQRRNSQTNSSSIPSESSSLRINKTQCSVTQRPNSFPAAAHLNSHEIPDSERFLERSPLIYGLARREKPISRSSIFNMPQPSPSSARSYPYLMPINANRFVSSDARLSRSSEISKTTSNLQREPSQNRFSSKPTCPKETCEDRQAPSLRSHLGACMRGHEMRSRFSVSSSDDEPIRSEPLQSSWYNDLLPRLSTWIGSFPSRQKQSGAFSLTESEFFPGKKPGDSGTIPAADDPSTAAHNSTSDSEVAGSDFTPTRVLRITNASYTSSPATSTRSDSEPIDSL